MYNHALLSQSTTQHMHSEEESSMANHDESNGHASLPASVHASGSSAHPQALAFAPDPTLPPGQGDIAALERLKRAIKENQHDIFRAVPRPDALASLWLGPTATANLVEVSENAPIPALVAPQTLATANNLPRQLAENVSHAVVFTPSPRSDSTTSQAGSISAFDGLTKDDHVMLRQDLHKDNLATPPENAQSKMDVEPLTPISVPSEQTHSTRDATVNGNLAPPSSPGYLRLTPEDEAHPSGGISYPQLSSPAGSPTSQPLERGAGDAAGESNHAYEPSNEDDSEKANGNSEQPKEEVRRSIYERSPELSRRLELVYDRKPNPPRPEPRSKPHLESRLGPRVNHSSRGNFKGGRQSGRFPRPAQAAVERSRVPPAASSTRLEDRISSPANPPVNKRAVDSFPKVLSDYARSPPPAEHRSLPANEQSVRDREPSPLITNHSVFEERQLHPNDQRAPTQQRVSPIDRPLVIETKAPKGMVENRTLAGGSQSLMDSSEPPPFTSNESRVGLDARPSYADSHLPPRSNDNRSPSLFEARRSIAGDGHAAPSPQPVSAPASLLSFPARLSFPRAQPASPDVNARMGFSSPARPTTPRLEHPLARAPSLQERISDAPLVLRPEETSRTLPPRMAAAVQAAEARGRKLSNASARADDHRPQYPSEPALRAISPPAPRRWTPPPEHVQARAMPPPDRRPPPPPHREHYPPPARRPSYQRPPSPPGPPARARSPVPLGRPLPPAQEYRRDSLPDYQREAPRARSPERRASMYDRAPPPPLPLVRRDPPAPLPPRRRYDEPPAPSPPPRYPPEPVRREPVRVDYGARPAYDDRAPPPPSAPPYNGRGHAPAPEWGREPYRGAPPAPVRDERVPPPRETYYPPDPAPYRPPTPPAYGGGPYGRVRGRSPADERSSPAKRAREDDGYSYVERDHGAAPYYPPPPVEVYRGRTPPMVMPPGAYRR